MIDDLEGRLAALLTDDHLGIAPPPDAARRILDGARRARRRTLSARAVTVVVAGTAAGGALVTLPDGGIGRAAQVDPAAGGAPPCQFATVRVPEPATGPTGTPSVTGEPSVTEEPSATDDPSATEGPPFADHPSFTEAPSFTDEPSAIGPEEPARKLPAAVTTCRHVPVESLVLRGKDEAGPVEVPRKAGATPPTGSGVPPSGDGR